MVVCYRKQGLTTDTSVPQYVRVPDKNDCVDHSCANGATCQDGVNSYSCVCPDGYIGDFCQSGTLFILMVYFL